PRPLTSPLFPYTTLFRSSGKLKVDLGRARAVALPPAETERRWRITTPQWPIMHCVLYGVTRDQLMARHKSNHVQVAYAPDAAARSEEHTSELQSPDQLVC